MGIAHFRTFPQEDLIASFVELVYLVPLLLHILHHGLPNFYLVRQSPPYHTTVVPLLFLRHLSLPNLFMRHDTYRSPLQRPYDSPFEVIAPGDNTFCIRIGSREDLITIDRLKPACVDPNDPVPVEWPPCRVRPQ